MKKQTVSIILPTFNRQEYVNRAIGSIMLQTYRDWELIVIDDASSDGTVSTIERIAEAHEKIHVYKNSPRKGLPGSRNIGICVSKGELIFFMEDDAFLDPNCIEILVNTFEDLGKRYKVGAIGPRIRDFSVKSSSTNNVVFFDKWTGLPIANFSININTVVEVPTLHSLSLISRKVFSEVGLYDENYYKGNFLREETDLFLRATKKSYRIFYQPHAILYHFPVSVGGCRLPFWKSEYYNFRNHLLFLVRFYGIKTLQLSLCYALKRIYARLVSRTSKLVEPRSNSILLDI